MAQNATPVVPRWEWRLFTETIADLERRVAGVAIGQPRVSDEVYLLDLDGQHNAKIRGDTLDIKVLEAVAHGGLEQWNPRFKAAFPLTPENVRAAFDVWGVAAPALSRTSYDQQGFLDEVVAPQRALRIAKVRKSRRAFTFAGCAAEFVEIETGGRRSLGFCIEHEDPIKLREAVIGLGLALDANTSFPTGLKRMLGLHGAPGAASPA